MSFENILSTVLLVALPVKAGLSYRCNQGGDTVSLGEAYSACQNSLNDYYHGNYKTSKKIGTSSDGWAQVWSTSIRQSPGADFINMVGLCYNMVNYCKNQNPPQAGRISKSEVTGCSYNKGCHATNTQHWSLQIIHSWCSMSLLCQATQRRL